MKEAIAVFDLGKTNKKILIYDEQFNIIEESETLFEETVDEDGYPCEDIQKVTNWMKAVLLEKLSSKAYKILAVNFSAYGASFVHIDKKGHPLGSFYNYLKPVSTSYYQSLYNNYGGEKAFTHATGSPSLAFLNSGLQLYWIKRERADIWSKIEYSLHLPQYLHFIFTGEVCSDKTSIGCHTALWDFNKDTYHKWVEDEQLHFPEIKSNDYTASLNILPEPSSVRVGIGAHDSTASIQPYKFVSQEKPFLLISTGTWAINMNPYNKEMMTQQQLKNDCLTNINASGDPILSSRYMLGRVHDIYSSLLAELFNISSGFYKQVALNEDLLKQAYDNLEQGVSIIKDKNELDNISIAHISTSILSVELAYHQLMLELSLIEISQIEEILSDKSPIENIYISGGFCNNELFCRIIASYFDKVDVYTLSIQNASALGAGLLVKPKHWTADIQFDKYKIEPLEMPILPYISLI